MILEEGGEREVETDLDLLFHFVMHSLVDSCMCPDQRSNPEPCANQLRYLALLENIYFKISISQASKFIISELFKHS